MKPLDLLRIGFVCLIGTLGSIQAAEWSAEQTEVWAAIEACDTKFREKRIEDGEEDYSQGRWTDIMIKEKGKWRWIADHGDSRPD